jgi:hypothetical protein
MTRLDVAHRTYFDAFIGNPPFMGGSRLTTEAGEAYSHWLAQQFEPAKGQTDLCAYFFRRAADLLGTHGASGFVATNTIAQGDTAASGLRVLLEQGCRIYAANRTVPWPGKAHVVVSVVHVARGDISHAALQSVLDGRVVPAINDRLEPKAPRKPPMALNANKGVAGLGVRIDGPGFLVPSESAGLVVHGEARGAGVLRPYVGAEELNDVGWQRPVEHVIDFHDLNEATAREKWPKLFEIVEQRVRPARVARGRPDDWWRFPIPRFYSTYSRGDREVLAAAIYTKHLIWSFVPGNVCLNSKIFIVDTSSRSAFAVLQSRIHEVWAWANSSTLKQDLAYSAQDAFQTFPFPREDVRASLAEVEVLGEHVHLERARYMVSEGVGLTASYNRLKDRRFDDAKIERLRQLHIDMDRAVLAAYGWSDMKVAPYTEPASDRDSEVLTAFREELLDRVSALNAGRAEEERLRCTAGHRVARGASSRRSSFGEHR